MTKNVHLSVLFFLLCCITIGLTLPGYGKTNGKVVAPAPQTPPAQIFPEHLLYQAFFAHLKHLEDKSQSPNKKPGEEKLNEHYKKKLKLTENEYQKLLKIANDYDAEMKAHKARSQEIINMERAKIPNGRLNKDQLPPVPEEVKKLQKEFEQILSKYSNKLKLDLPQNKTSQIAAFLRQEFGSQLRVMKVDIPRDRNPGKQKPPLFEK